MDDQHLEENAMTWPTNNDTMKRGANSAELTLPGPCSIGDQVYQLLSDRILTGQFKPGERLRIQEVAKNLGVSDTPVREALLRLQHKGLVERIARAESRVRIFTRRDIEEIYDIRQALECFSVKRAVERMPDGELHRLEDLQVTAEDALDQGEIAPALAADIELHAQIILSTGNARISTLMANIQDQMQMFRRVGARTIDVPRAFLKDHHRLIETLLARNAMAAVNVMEEHLQLAKDQTLRSYAEAASIDPMDTRGQDRNQERERNQFA
jgi:GntR family transcriptional regulator, rspAB operon transcriptional repressor